MRDLCNVTEEDTFHNIYQYVRNEAEKHQIKSLLDWLDDKQRNEWVLQCISPATSKMSKADWYTTSCNTNVAESAHAHSQRDGTRLSLVSAILKARKLDAIHFECEEAIRTMGIGSRYGNSSSSGRAAKNLNRSKAAAKKRVKGNVELQQQEDVLARAQDLIYEGMSKEVVGAFLKSKSLDRT